MSIAKKSILLIVLVVIVDQLVKLWIKTHMFLGEDSLRYWDFWKTHWFIIHFTENNGMAFGLEIIGGKFGKIALSVLRLLAVGAIVWLIRGMIKKKAPVGVVLSFSLIFAGAVGNIIDSAFYGLIFSSSRYGEIASLFPEGAGYAGFLQGKVVDMLYFPLIEGNYPSWFPIWAGEPFVFFRPVFNIADSAISVGVAIILIFYRQYFKTEFISENETKPKEILEKVAE